MPRKAKPSMIWDSKRIPLLPGEKVEFHRKVYKTVPNKLRYRLVGEKMTPRLINLYTETVLRLSFPDRCTIDRRRLSRVATGNWRNIEVSMAVAEKEFEEVKTALEERARLRETLHKKAKATLRQELVTISQEFERMQIVGSSEVTVVFRDVRIEDVFLGSFVVGLNIETGSISVQPLDRATHNFADGNQRGHWHPHVSTSGAVCLGTAANPIRQALAEGLLFDIFNIMKAHIHSYTPGDAHCKIDRWSKIKEPCSDCGMGTEGDRLYTCSCSCNHKVRTCTDCTATCVSCGRPFCAECVVTCEICGAAVCDTCLTNENHCQQCATRERERRA